VLNQLAALLVMDRTSLYRTIRGIEEAGWVTINEGRAGATGADHAIGAGAAARRRARLAGVCGPKSTTVWAMTAGSD
jgi:alpha-D-ribose 1-methylphosphonate 5-triphosphate synthase subunit PhnG